MMSTLVSVIIPTHNRYDLLPRAIRSVLRQTYTNLECIVVDDDSTDATAQVVRQFSDERLIYLHHDTNRYASAARNTGIARARGDLIAFLDDDDEWLPTKLEKQVALIQSMPPEVGMVYCWMDYLGTHSRLLTEHHPTYRGYVFPYVLDAQRIGNSSTLLVRRSVIEQVGGFDEKLLRFNDHDFILKVSLKFRVYFVPEVLVRVYIEHPYERISRSNRQGTKNAVRAEEDRLIKYKRELRKYPRQTARLYALMAYRYGKLGSWQNSVTFFCKSLMTFPFSIVEVYTNLLAKKFQVLIDRSCKSL